MERTNIERAVLIAGAAATFSFAELLETQAAEVPTPQETAQFVPIEALNPSEVIDFKAQFLQIPAFNVTDPSSDSEQIKAQDTLSAWVKVSEQAATDNGFLPTDFEATVKAVTQNGKTYNVSQTSLLKDVEVSIQQNVSTIKKNSLLVPYLTSDGLAVAVMSDTDGEGAETTVGSYIATIGDASIAIPARFDKDHNPVSFMEFVTDANGEVQPQEVAVSKAIINSDQSNIRDVQDPSVVIGKIDKGTEIILVGNDADAQPVSGKNFGVLLAVTPEGKTFTIATSLVKRVENTTNTTTESLSSPYESSIIPGLMLGEQDLTNPDIVAAMEKTNAVANYGWNMYKEANMTAGIRLLNLETPESPKLSQVKYEGFTANYITLESPIINPVTREKEGETLVDVILTVSDPSDKFCNVPAKFVVTMKNGEAKKWQQQGLYSMKDNVFTPNREVTIFSLPVNLWTCGHLPDVLTHWKEITQSNNDVVTSELLLVNSK